MGTQRNAMRGVASALIGAIAWGFSGTCVQYLFAEASFDALLITTIRQFGAGLVFMAVLLLRDRALLKAMWGDRDTRRQLLIFGSFGLFLNSTVYSQTVGITNAGTATVLQSLSIVIVLVVSCLRNRRMPKLLEIAALVCAFAAVFLISTGGDPGTLQLPLMGLLFGLASAFACAFYTSYPKGLMSRYGSFATTGAGMMVGGITGLVVWTVTGGVARGIPPIDGTTAGVLAIATLIGTFGAYWLYLNGISIVGPVAGNMLGAAEPVSATVISALWLGTSFAWSDWAGLVLMVATIILVAWEQGRGTRSGDAQDGDGLA